MCTVKYLPAWFPGAGYKGHIREWGKIVAEMFDRPSLEVKSALVSLHTFLSSIASSLLLGFIGRRQGEPFHRG